MGFPTADDDPDSPCDKCGAPASWADEWTSNMTRREGMAFQFAKYLASPRMWPFGYIIDGPYSPFQVERQMPNKNWRDAFEDLLALDSGGRMIELQYRKREAAFATQLWTQRIYRRVSAINQQLKREEKAMSLTNRTRAVFVRRNQMDGIKMVDEKILKAQKEKTKNLITEGQTIIAQLQDDKIRGRPASMFKLRGEWMTSLISSGAIMGWESNLYDSSDGYYLHFKRTKPAKNGDHDGVWLTELELKTQFEDDVSRNPAVPPPSWTTESLQYPIAISIPPEEDPGEDAIGDPDTDDVEPKPPPIPMRLSPRNIMPLSILAQKATAERTILRNGTMSVKVLLKNHHANGKMVETELRDDPCRVLEEVEHAHQSMVDMHGALQQSILEHVSRLHEKSVSKAEEDLD